MGYCIPALIAIESDIDVVSTPFPTKLRFYTVCQQKMEAMSVDSLPVTILLVISRSHFGKEVCIEADDLYGLPGTSDEMLLDDVRISREEFQKIEHETLSGLEDLIKEAVDNQVEKLDQVVFSGRCSKLLYFQETVSRLVGKEKVWITSYLSILRIARFMKWKVCPCHVYLD